MTQLLKSEDETGEWGELKTYVTKADRILVRPHSANGILCSEVLGFFLCYLHDSKFTFIVIPWFSVIMIKNEIK